MPLLHLAHATKAAGVTVVQVGEGSDEQFCGYSLYKKVLHLQEQFRFVRSLPGSLRSAGYGLLSPILKSLSMNYRQNYIKNFLAANGTFLGGGTAFDDAEKRKLLRSHAGDSAPMVDMAFQSVPGDDYSTKMIYWEFKNRLPELLLMRVDKMTMATSVEARVPFLDHKLVEFSMKIPWRLKIKNGETKYILKKALEPILPQSILHRKKKGFGVPIGTWFKDGELTINDTAPHQSLNCDFIRKKLSEHLGGRVDQRAFLWNVWLLEHWSKS